MDSANDSSEESELKTLRMPMTIEENYNPDMITD